MPASFERVTIRRLAALALIAAAGSVHAADNLPWQEARRLVDAMEKIRAQYVEPVDDATLIQNAIRGMAAGLDPYSAYLSPEEHEQLRIDARGRYEGIGLEVAQTAEGFVIIAPLDGSPAARAGLLPGDRLLRVNGVPLDEADPAMLDRLLAGPAETQVRLTVQRGDEQPFEVQLKRETITIPSVSGRRLADDIFYARISLFSDGSARDLAALLAEHKVSAANTRGLILDLRNNAGGVVEGAVAIADELLDRGTIMSVQGRDPMYDMEFHAAPGSIAEGVPMVVLINSGTASAAEILAGALKDQGRALLAGTRSFGKGAMQSLIPLEDGGALKLTIAYYRTPAGHRIHESGIVPDVIFDGEEVPPAENARDPWVERAIALLGMAE